MTFYNPQETEKEISKYWEWKGIPEKIVEFTGKKKFYLLDGPPYVNYAAHVGHVKTTTLKDIWGKFKKMQGHSVWFQPGFDCSGLPIENAVEKKLDIKLKSDIETKVGLDTFIKECEALAKGNEKTWMDMYKQLGAWRGWVEPYMTFKNSYVESGWWTLQQWFEKGLLVEGYKPGYWCSSCETVLAGYEVSDSYKNIEDTSVFVKFPVKNKEHEFLLVWTTTPWTLPSNVVIAVHPDETYVRVEVDKQVLILAEKLLSLLDGQEFTVLEKTPGKKLEGLRYEPLLDVPLQKTLSEDEKAHQVIVSVPIMKKRVLAKTLMKKGAQEKEEFGHIVDTVSGTGLVHIAPGHGEVDNRIGKHYGLPQPSPVNEAGELTKEAGEFAGNYVRVANAFIIKYLESRKLLFKAEKIVHSYPLCWRCKTPLIFRMSHQWFLKIDTLRQNMLKENEQVKWLPEFARERFRTILEEAPDWAITRQRYWGIPLPVWVCQGCKSKKIIGSRKELKEQSLDKISVETDLHKNTVDKIKLSCQCGGVMERVKDIVDVWFDSGIAPWASLGYPFKNKELFETLWPVDLIDESQDQVRGWFYSLMLCGYATFGKRPYETVCLNGWMTDHKGDKMSKSVGNVVWATDGLQELGADVLRLYYASEVAPWETQKFNMTIAKDLRRTLNVLWNVYEFMQSYGDKKAQEQPQGKQIEDDWIISRVNSVIETVTGQYETFEFHSAGRTLKEFVLNDFSRWYVKLIRDRVSPFHDGEDKEHAQWVLNYVLERVLKLLAPITPYITEKIYKEYFGQNETIHLESWPDDEKPRQFSDLESNMVIVQKIIENVNALRQEKKAKLRWPLEDIIIEAKNEQIAQAVRDLADIIKHIGNVNEVKLGKAIEGKEYEHAIIQLGKVNKEEALIRELIRKIQDLRKKNDFIVTDTISLWLESDEKTHDLLKKYEKQIGYDVGAKAVSFSLEHAKGELEFSDTIVKIGFKKD